MPTSTRVATEITQGIDEEFGDWLSLPDDAEIPPPPPVEDRGLPAEPEPEPATSTFSFEPTPRVRAAARGDSGRWLDAHLLTIVAAAASVPALRIPEAWVVVCSIVALVMLGVGSVRGQVKAKGSADVVVVPGRVAGKLLLGVINPVNWLKVLLGALASLTVGALVAAVIAAAQWLVAHGTDGILAAVRMGAWAHALTWAALVASFILLRGIGRTHERRAIALHRVTRRVPEAAVAGVTVCVIVACGVLALAGPRTDIGFIHDADGLGWVPGGLRSDVDGLRDDIVDNELESATDCLANGQAGLWTPSYTGGNATDAPDVARITADPARAPDQSALAAAALVAHNHLAPWVETIEVAVGDQVVLTVDRRALPHDEPVTDAATLRAHSVGAPEWLTAIAPTVNTDTVLTCSARTPL